MNAPFGGPDSRAARVWRLGLLSWAVLGIIAVCLVAAAALGAISGIAVPLVIAVVIGTLLEPLTRWLRRVGVSTTLAAVLALLLVAIAAVAFGTAVVLVLIAFGSGGPTAALIVALSLLVSNGTIQSAVNSWILGASLKMHPVAVLLAAVENTAAAIQAHGERSIPES